MAECDETESSDFSTVSDDSEVGYILEVDYAILRAYTIYIQIIHEHLSVNT